MESDDMRKIDFHVPGMPLRLAAFMHLACRRYSRAYVERLCGLTKTKEECLGLSHLDAEVVIWFSSAYKGTPESQSTAKKYT